MRRGLLAASVLVAGAVVLPSCAPKPAPPIPEGEDYVYPIPEASQVSADERRDLEKAWRRVLAGDERAVGEYQKILNRRPDLVAAETGIGYARLRGGQVDGARSTFDTVLEKQPTYVPALVGAGSAAFRAGDVDGALALYRHALEVAPDHPVVKKRHASLKLQVTERHMAAAQAALQDGDEDTAAREYQATLVVAPELAGMRLALADLLVARGEGAKAVATLREDPYGDRRVALRLGEILMERGDFAEARDVYRDVVRRHPSDAQARQGAVRAQDALDFRAQPEEYRQIASASRARRADLASLLVVKVPPLGRLPETRPRVAVDVSGSWAREHIARVIGLGIMDVYPNHTFQPRATVGRGDLARATSRVLRMLGRRPRGMGPTPRDMRPSHLDYDAVVTVVGSGLMKLRSDGRFEPLRPVSGREAVEVVDALARIAGP